MLRASRILKRRGMMYQDRYMEHPHQKKKPYYTPGKTGHKRTPYANKIPTEYADTKNTRNGVEWYWRMKRRGEYNHWPWTRWNDDPLRHHKQEQPSRCLNVKVEKMARTPTFMHNAYSMVHEDYDALTADIHPKHLAPHIHLFTSKSWSLAEIKIFLEKIGQRFPTIRKVVEEQKDLELFNSRHFLVPPHFVPHVIHVCHAAHEHISRKSFRRELHNNAAVLRTNDMEQYYALPYTRGNAMPDRLDGVYPSGRYLMMNGGTKISRAFGPLSGTTKRLINPM